MKNKNKFVFISFFIDEKMKKTNQNKKRAFLSKIIKQNKIVAPLLYTFFKLIYRVNRYIYVIDSILFIRSILSLSLFVLSFYSNRSDHCCCRRCSCCHSRRRRLLFLVVVVVVVVLRFTLFK